MIATDVMDVARRTGVLVEPKCMSRSAAAGLGGEYERWCAAVQRPRIYVRAWGRGGRETISVDTVRPCGEGVRMAVQGALRRAMDDGRMPRCTTLWARTGDGFIVDGCHRGDGLRVAMLIAEALSS